MLNISHRQTTADHPELNGAVERLHRRLKNEFRARIAAGTWAEELPFVLLSLCAQPREDTGLSPAEAVFGAPIVLPNEFLQGDKISVDSIIKIFSKTLDAPVFSLPRHNSSTQLPSELPAKLLSARRVWVHLGSTVPPLQPLYDGPFAVLRQGSAPSPAESGRRMISSLSATSSPGQPGVPSLAVRVAAAHRRASAQAVPLPPSESHFQTR